MKTLKIQKIDLTLYRHFSFAILSLTENKLDLSTFGEYLNEIKVIGYELFKDYIEISKVELGNIDISISALDIPSDPNFSVEKNFILGLACFIAIFSNITSPICHEKNTPFRVHKAKHSNVKDMNAMGIKLLGLEDKLGFHNDGVIENNKVTIPKYIALFNSFIGYKNAGDFYWVPAKSLETKLNSDNLKDFFGKKAVIKLTPTVYENTNGSFTKSGPSHVLAPLIWNNQNNEKRFFLNGDVLEDNNNNEVVKSFSLLRESIDNSEECIKIPQRERRAIFLNNISGFHARDIFADPILDLDLSRVFIRSVSKEGEICQESSVFIPN